MGWELYRTEYKECPCKKGKIRIEHFSDDWNGYDTQYTIECESCKNMYHVETQSCNKPQRGTVSFLVKNGETTNFNPPVGSFEESMVHIYTKEELEHLYEKLLSIPSAKNVNRNVVKEHKRWYKTEKMKEIRIHIREAIDRYDTFMYNKETIELKQAECRKVNRFYLS